MNPLPNEWAIKHRADSCAVTQRPFVPGEYFYTLLYHGADGYRREDLSEEAWQSRNENIRPFSFWKSRYEPLPPKPAEPRAQGKCRATLSAFDGVGFTACKRLLRPGGHARTKTCFETGEDRRIPRWRGRVLIYEQGSTGDVFIVPDPQLRLDELENVQNEVAELLREAAQNG